MEVSGQPAPGSAAALGPRAGPLRGASLAWAGFLAFAALTVAANLHHSPWGDELQALMIASTTSGPAELIAALRYEGHPALWYLWLKAALVFVDGPGALKLAQLPVAVGILALVWLRAPFPLLVRLALSSGYLLLFEYTVIARSYGLGVLLFLLFIVARRSPWAWVLLGLMANVSLHFAALAGVCGLLLLRIGCHSRPAMMASVALVALSAFSAWPAPDVATAVTMGSWSERILLATMRLSATILPLSWQSAVTDWPLAERFLRLVLGPLSVLAGMASLRRRPDLQAAFASVVIAIFAISTMLYPGFDRHIGIIWCALIGFHWILISDNAAPLHPIFRAWALLSGLLGPLIALPLLLNPLSGGDAAAAWLRARSGPETVAALPGMGVTELSARLGKPVFNLQAGRFERYVRWDYKVVGEYPDNLPVWAAQAPPGPLLIAAYRTANTAPLGPRTLGNLKRQGLELTLLRSFEGQAFSFDIYRADRLPRADAAERD